jgi:hypothetical protein
MGRPRRPVPPEGRHKLAIWLPRLLYRRLRVWAFFREQELSAMVSEALERYLAELDRDREAQGLPRLPDE